MGVRFATLTCEELESNMEVLLEVYRKAYQEIPEYAYHDPERIRGYMLWLWRGDPNGFWVALVEEKVVGFVSIHGEWKEEQEIIGEIHEFLVDPCYQGRGIGTRLFGIALQYAQSKERKRIGLWVGEKNWKAQEFYLRQGFEKGEQWGKWIRMIKEVGISESP